MFVVRMQIEEVCVAIPANLDLTNTISHTIVYCPLYTIQPCRLL
jgi:hypothetical protein